MKFRKFALALIALTLIAVGCSSSSDYVYVEPASVSEAGTDLWRVTLTPSAAERTGLETVAVAAATVAGAQRLVIPYSAVFYHYDGSTWTYTDEGDYSYLRAPIEIERIEGDRAILNAGPPAGQQVVAVGAAELYGVEFGIGK